MIFLRQVLYTYYFNFSYIFAFLYSGLAMSLNDAKKSFAKRIWIVDNSGSMQATDGHRIVATGRKANQMKVVPSSRWEEIQDCVGYHIQIAAAMEAPTTFRVSIQHQGESVVPMNL